MLLHGAGVVMNLDAIVLIGMATNFSKARVFVTGVHHLPADLNAERSRRFALHEAARGGTRRLTMRELF